MPGQELSTRPLAERRLVLVYLLVCCLTLAHAIYVEYGAYFADIHSNHAGMTQQEYYKLHSTIAVSSDHPLFRGEDFAPDQYRIGVVFAARLVGDRLGMTKYYIAYSVFDFLCAMVASLICYRNLIASGFFSSLLESERKVAVLALLLALLYPFAWVVPWERPETLPSALYAIVCLALLGGARSRRSSGKWSSLGVLGAATLLQSLVRTDIPLTLGASLILLGCSAWGARLAGSRAACIGVGAAVAAIAAGVQIYLQFLRFPLATYPPGVKMLHLSGNLEPRQLIVFAIALLPWTILMRLLSRFRAAMEPEDVLAAIASCLYLPLWWTVGILVEVRLFVPFLLALTPTAAKLMVLFLRGDGTDAAKSQPISSGFPAGAEVINAESLRE